MIRQVAFVLFSVAALAACNPYDPELPNKPFLCGGPDNDQCPEGFTCNDDMVCENVSTAAGVDASVGFQCADDSRLEPNDLPSQAYVTPIPNSTRSHQLAGLAICPPGDKDSFRFGVDDAGTKLEVTVTGLASRPSLLINLLNANGTKIGEGSPVAGTPQQVRLANQDIALGIGNYTIQVLAADGQENNYEILIKTCPSPLPCS